jgi:alkylation response protein AidB-like acyl-CoA dehydrogenase
MSEPEAGSDVQSIRTKAIRDGDDYVVNGQKMWLTNGLRAGLVMTLVKTDPEAVPPHKGMSMLMVEKEPGEPKPAPGLDVGKNIDKMGYKGVETVEMSFNDYRIPTASLLGTEEGQGFRQVLDGIEVGRVNVAARAVGLSTRAFEEAIKYAQERKAFGKPISQHQAIQIHLAEMGTSLEAARLMLYSAAERKSAGERSDLEAGMAKLFASEACHEICLKALRVHGGYGYSKEFTVERLYRDAPFLLIGEGTSEIQKTVIARRLLEKHKI